MITSKYILADATHSRLSDLLTKGQMVRISSISSQLCPQQQLSQTLENSRSPPSVLYQRNIGLPDPTQSHTWKDLLQTTVTALHVAAASSLQMQPPTSQQNFLLAHAGSEGL